MFKYSFNPNEDRGGGCGRDFNNSNEREQWGWLTRDGNIILQNKKLMNYKNKCILNVLTKEQQGSPSCH